MTVMGNIGGFGLSVFVQGPATSYAFGNQAAMVTNINCIGTPLVALLFSVPFARWADSKTDPRMGLYWVIIGAQSPSFAMMFDGFQNPGKRSIWGFIIWCAVVGPMRCQMSGNPVLWAAYSDKVPPDVREFGFQILATLPSLSILAICPICNSLTHSYPIDYTDAFALSYIQIFQYTFIVCFFLTLLTIFFMKNTRSPWTLAAMEQRKEGEELDESEEHSSFNYCRVIGNAFEFFRSNTVLLAVAGALSVYTLPDLAASYPAGQIYYTVQNIAVVDDAIYGNSTNYANGTSTNGLPNDAYIERVQHNRDAQISMSNWMTNWPVIIGFVMNVCIAFAANKFGPARTMVVWVPITCLLFSLPFLMYFPWGQDNPIVYIAVAVGVGSASSVFPPLQALATLAVPVERVAEALGCVAMCKDFMSLMAPILMMGVMGLMDAQADNDADALAKAYRWIFPGCACLMFMAWPFVVYLAIHTSPKLPDMDDGLFASAAMSQCGPDFAASVSAVMSKKAAASRNVSSSVAQSVHESMVGSRAAAASEARASLRDSEVKT